MDNGFVGPLCFIFLILIVIAELWIMWIAISWLLIAIFGVAMWYVVVFFILLIVSIQSAMVRNNVSR